MIGIIYTHITYIAIILIGIWLVWHRIGELKERKEFAEKLVQNSIIPTFVVDSEHKVIIWNEACEELTGIKASEMIGTNNHWKPFYETKRPCISDFIFDGSYNELPKYYKTFSKSIAGLHGEGWYYNLGGKDRFGYFDAVPVKNTQGQIVAAIETIHDITQLKIAEEQASENEQMFRSIFEQSAVGIVYVGMDGQWLRINERFCEIVGYTFDELQNLSFEDLNHPDDFDKDFERIERMFLNDIDTFSIEKRFLRKDKSIVWTNCTASLAKDDNNNPKYFIWVIQDISMKKLTEQALKEKSYKMEKELQLASTIQNKLLPKELPNCNSVNFAWEFMPSVFIAGDMFNIFTINDDYIGIYILDVMGHGISAALKAITISYILKPTSSLSSFFESDNSDGHQNINLPSNILNYLNEHFSFEDENQSFFTIFYGILNIKKMELTYSRAGHCSPVVVTSEGEVKELSNGGPAIGLSENSNYKNFTCKFNKGDKMFLYTDGITEAKNENKEVFSKKRFIEFLVEKKDMDNSRLVGELIQEVKKYTQNRAIEDDLTLFSFEIKGK